MKHIRFKDTNVDRTSDMISMIDDVDHSSSEHWTATGKIVDVEVDTSKYTCISSDNDNDNDNTSDEYEEDMDAEGYTMKQYIHDNNILVNTPGAAMSDNLCTQRCDAYMLSLNKLSERIDDRITPLLLTKLEYLYIIIRNGGHVALYDEIKDYPCKKMQHIRFYGVYKTDTFILRISEVSDECKSEQELIDIFGPGINPHVNMVIPYITSMYKRPRRTRKKDEVIIETTIGSMIFDRQEEMKEDDHSEGSQNEEIDSDAADATKTTETTTLAHPAIQMNPTQEKIKNIHSLYFSIQPRVRQSLTLHEWLRSYNTLINYNSFYTYLQLFYQLMNIIAYMHSRNVIHGDIKSGNIMIKKSKTMVCGKLCDISLYLIDFGLSGVEGVVEGTGGTSPYCHPETKNIQNVEKNTGAYVWCKSKKKYDVWSATLLFTTIFIFRKCKSYYTDYPRDFFRYDGYINPAMYECIPYKYRPLFVDIMATSEYTPASEVCDRISELIKRY